MDPEDLGDNDSSSSLAQPLLDDDEALLSSFPRHSHSRDASSVGVEISAVDEGTDNNDRQLLGFKGPGIPTIVIIVISLLVLLVVLFLTAVLMPQKSTT